jgi:hypothetical protein
MNSCGRPIVGLQTNHCLCSLPMFGDFFAFVKDKNCLATPQIESHFRSRLEPKLSKTTTQKDYDDWSPVAVLIQNPAIADSTVPRCETLNKIIKAINPK